MRERNTQVQKKTTVRRFPPQLLLIVAILSLMATNCVNKGDAAASSSASGEQADDLSSFVSLDLDDQVYTQDYFKDYNLTLVTVWSTSCEPCAEQLPVFGDLEKIYGSVGFLGMVADVVDDSGIEVAKKIANKAGLRFPQLLPTEELCEAKLYEVERVPVTFFVDKSGKQIGMDYEGTRSKEAWKKLIDEHLDKVLLASGTESEG